MGTAATKAKRKWNNQHYTNVTAAMKQEMAAELKQRCKENGVSVTSVITELVAEYLSTESAASNEILQKMESDSQSRICTRRELWKHIAAIEELLRNEEKCTDIPFDITSGIQYENAKSAEERFRLAIEELRDIYQETR